MKPKIIGITGSSGSGKTTLSKELVGYYAGRSAEVSEDDYYCRKLKELRKSDDFDSPKALDHDLLGQQLELLKSGETVNVPIYDFTRSCRTELTREVSPVEYIFVEGALILHSPEVRKHLDVIIFVDTDLMICRERRLKRDVGERGRKLEQAKAQWEAVAACYYEHVEPNKIYASLVVENNVENSVFDISAISREIETKVIDNTSEIQLCTSTHAKASASVDINNLEEFRA